MYLNQLTIIGFTGQDADFHYTPNGTAVTTFSVATKAKPIGILLQGRQSLGRLWNSTQRMPRRTSGTQNILPISVGGKRKPLLKPIAPTNSIRYHPLSMRR